MTTFFRKLSLVLWKNLIIRKRHWLLTIFEIVIPTLLFIMLAAVRSDMTASTDDFHPESYSPVWSESQLIESKHIPTLLFAPAHNFTTRLVKEVAKELRLKGKCNFISKLMLKD